MLERKNSKDVALFAELGLEPGADARPQGLTRIPARRSGRRLGSPTA